MGTTTFTKEKDFEDALVNYLIDPCGWKDGVLEYKTEAELLRNWADILYSNNRKRDRLNNYPLTDGEMQQIIEQINKTPTPLELNGFINGKSVQIKRDNPDDKEHFGKEISLKIYDRKEIAAGQSRYQIARQPQFTAKTKMLPDRRGDLMLLINGMPVIHIELKKSGISYGEACNQIRKYSHEGVFTGLFALVQVFVAMTPEETVYFANPGSDGAFNPAFYFHWADFNNEPINEWGDLAKSLLSIPMAHQLIGFYTVPDKKDHVLKVMRSYQYYAAREISNTVEKYKWNDEWCNDAKRQLGGFVWHTTGSGKTMTSFKSAQLIANSDNADKVVFLIDRIELGTQSAEEYRGFAEETEAIQETEDTQVLVSKLKSNNPSDTLIVTSVQKMSNIGDDTEIKLKESDLKIITGKRVVFIVDECHRSTFGDMMVTIKRTFSNALFFGFSGTPIQMENQKKGCTTVDIFGDELHRYSIADGIRDKNVLAFDPYQVFTFKEADVRKVVALEKAKAETEEEVLSDSKKEEVYYKYMNEIPMASVVDAEGKKTKGIEEYLLECGQYETPEHREMVVKDICENYRTISRGKFHGIFATTSISDAVEYYRLFKKEAPTLKVTALFDPSIDNDGNNITKEDALKEIIEDYNTRYNQTFTIPTWDRMKKDIQMRLAHKGTSYGKIEKKKEEQLDLLIVVDQMLTGYDSKWVNVLYLDKILKYENIIQAFSRTNRIFGKEKPFGTIRYYRAPNTMEQNIKDAIKLYSGDKPMGMFVVKLDKNIENMNATFTEIKNLFKVAGIINFEKLPEENAVCGKFAKLFKQFNEYLEAAKVQGFVWERLCYDFADEGTGELRKMSVDLDEMTYKVLIARYKELFKEDRGGVSSEGYIPYDLDGYLTTISTDDIDAAYMEKNFEKYRKALKGGNEEELKTLEEELHKTFATLSQEAQKYANILLNDIQAGNVEVESGKTFLDYVYEYMRRGKEQKIHKFAETFGCDEYKLGEFFMTCVSEANINEYGRFNTLKKTVDKTKAMEYFKSKGEDLKMPQVNTKVGKILHDFIMSGECDI